MLLILEEESHDLWLLPDFPYLNTHLNLSITKYLSINTVWGIVLLRVNVVPNTAFALYVLLKVQLKAHLAKLITLSVTHLQH